MTRRSFPPNMDQPHDVPEQGGARGAVRRLVFGKRLRSPEREISFRRERLRIIAAELNLLFAHKLDVEMCFAELVDDGEPSLIIGHSMGFSLFVEIEAASGFFVLYEQSPLPGGGSADCVLMTGREERLLDQIVGLVSGHAGELTPRTADAAIDMLVGRTITEVERRLVLRTLLHFRGDYHRAAGALEMAPDVLRKRVRQYLLDMPRDVWFS